MKPKKYGWYKFPNKLEVKFVTDNPDFYNFVDQSFTFFKKETKKPSPDLEARVFFFRKNNFHLEKKIAKNLFFDDNQVLYQDKLGFKIHAQENKSLQIKTFVWKQLLYDVFNLIVSGKKSAREEKYLTVMRASLHLPLFYLLSKKGFIILHGSAVSKNNKAYLFLGANRVGKTTTILNLIYRYGFKLLSDDFLVIKDNKIYAFPDKIRAFPATLNSLPIEKEGSLIYSKHHLTLPPSKITPFSFPAKIFFVHLGPKLTIKKMSPENAQKRINVTHNYLRELPEHSYLAFLPRFPSTNEVQRRYSDFFRDKKIFSFQSSTNIDKNLNLLLKELS